MIPKIIWQTYECDYQDLDPKIKSFSESWKNKNKNWEYRYMSSNDRDDFVLNNFGQEWFEIFKNCKLGIVKANVWRYMVLYIYGGLYCDLDTSCNIPIDEWINNDYDVILSRDDDGNPENFSMHTFASKEKSKLMYDTIQTLKINILNNEINKNNMVELTGEAILSSIIKNNKKLYNFYSYEKGSNMFNGVASSHMGTSKKWSKYGYLQWNLEEDNANK